MSDELSQFLLYIDHVPGAHGVLIFAGAKGRKKSDGAVWGYQGAVLGRSTDRGGWRVGYLKWDGNYQLFAAESMQQAIDVFEEVCKSFIEERHYRVKLPLINQGWE